MRDRGVNRPARPIRYGLAARAVDWWSARSEARAGLPSLDGAAPALRPATGATTAVRGAAPPAAVAFSALPTRRQAAFTPKLERLRRSASDAIEHELLRLERERSAPARRLATVREELPAAETAV